MTAADVKAKLRSLADPKIADHSKRFFKTGSGEYGEGDLFLGIRMPAVRKTARNFKNLSLVETEKLLHSKYHEERHCALIILVNTFRSASQKEQKRIYQLYLANTSYINNWDLVDSSAHKILGPYLKNKKRDMLYHLVKSKSLWERRIAIMSTLYFIKNDDFADTLQLCKLLLDDEHDLIHKASGWMLREIGKRNMETEEKFLINHAGQMPRTMLRYAIEKFPEAKRKEYLKK